MVDLFYGRGRIKRRHRQQNFIPERFHGRGRTMFYGGIKSEYAIKKQKYTKNKVIFDVPNYFNAWTYSNAEEIFWTDLMCHMKERAWTLKEKYTLRICWIPYSTIRNVTAHHYPLKIFKKQLKEPWQEHKRKINMLNVTSIILLWILCFSPLSLSMHKRKIQMWQMRDKFLCTFIQKRWNNSRDFLSNQQAAILHTVIPRNWLTP